MGIGSPLELLAAIYEGADCFDSAYPTRMARHGKIFTANGPIQISRGIYKNDFSPLDTNCSCPTCKKYSRAYLHHLYKTYEQNAHLLLTQHNLYFISQLIENSRIAIEENSFSKFKKEFESNYKR
jgi:queuine tRNA-ribosyltransferase